MATVDPSVGSARPCGARRALAAEDSWLMVACGEEGLRLLDLSDPVKPRAVSIAAMEDVGTVYDVAIAHGTAMAIGDRRIEISLASSTGGPRVLGFGYDQGHYVAVGEEAAYFVDKFETCSVFRAELGGLAQLEPLDLGWAEPVEFGERCLQLRGLEVAGERLLAPYWGMDMKHVGVAVFDIGGPKHIVQRSVIPSSAPPSDLAAWGDRAAAVGPDGLSISKEVPTC